VELPAAVVSTVEVPALAVMTAVVVSPAEAVEVATMAEAGRTESVVEGLGVLFLSQSDFYCLPSTAASCY